MSIYHFGALRESLTTSGSAESPENTPAMINNISSAIKEPHKDIGNVTYHLEKTAEILEDLTEKAEGLTDEAEEITEMAYELNEKAFELKEKADELSHHLKALRENGCDDVHARIEGLITPRRRDAVS
ncbi:hypothetical protein DIS24_g8740 [Lasiodiplodia hormozganensis]|uniref:Uncharacterized protein n=1 Tax=Lasiodiplodia hormozganensis TaxID=869390 RepID=A0AA40CKX0_9PEZI|nr:hypothetical protein DIS24_g8740 [Lasiodiplodia hormozganensis]